ncbi:MAG: hypothetical protein FWG88_00505 [Oscillospiraceae bacterium]|nr:hypothetical protein [Oscillospiraceae bacterium]
MKKLTLYVVLAALMFLLLAPIAALANNALPTHNHSFDTTATEEETHVVWIISNFYPKTPNSTIYCFYFVYLSLYEDIADYYDYLAHEIYNNVCIWCGRDSW